MKLCWPLQRTYHVMGKVRSLRSQEKALCFLFNDVSDVDMKCHEWIYFHCLPRGDVRKISVRIQKQRRKCVTTLKSPFLFALLFPCFSNSLICMEGSSVPNNLTRLWNLRWCHESAAWQAGQSRKLDDSRSKWAKWNQESFNLQWSWRSESSWKFNVFIMQESLTRRT